MIENKHIYILATLPKKNDSVQFSRKLFCYEPEMYYETTTFFLHHNCMSYLCFVYEKDSYSHGLIFFHRVFFFFGIRCYFLYQAYWTFWRSCSYRVPRKWPRTLSYIHDSSSLACRNSYCIHHNVSNLLLPLTVFWGESCLKLCYPLK